jgi:serine/threonine-protein kinase
VIGLIWAPDGKHLAYGTEPGINSGLMWIRADGAGEPRRLTEPDLQAPYSPYCITPDGQQIVFGRPGRGGGILWSLSIDNRDPDQPRPSPPVPLLKKSGRPGGAAISPDGRWLAYASSDSGGAQVFVRPFTQGKAEGGVLQISADGGAFPVWSRAASQLLYVSPDNRVMVADYRVAGESFQAFKPRLWADKPIGTSTPAGVSFDIGFPPFDLMPGGERIITVAADERPKEAKVNLHVTLLVNWFDELRRRLPASAK